MDIRTQFAKSYGYSDYAAYAYDKMYQRDYEYDDLKAYRQSIKDNMVPMQDEMFMEIFYNSDFSEAMDQSMSEKECLANLRKYLP